VTSSEMASSSTIGADRCGYKQPIGSARDGSRVAGCAAGIDLRVSGGDVARVGAKPDTLFNVRLRHILKDRARSASGESSVIVHRAAPAPRIFEKSH
jgi:hypothetical protein